MTIALRPGIRTSPCIEVRNLRTSAYVFRLMRGVQRKIGGPEWLLLIGASVFILVLAFSAIWQADIRWLHFFQAWMYIAAIALSVRGIRWGYFIGISAAGLWDYINLFVTNFLASGLHHLNAWMTTGHLTRPDQIIAIPAWTANLLVLVGCTWAYARRERKSWGDLPAFLLAFALTTAFLAADMALFQPRYLALFPRLLHPHWP